MASASSPDLTEFFKLSKPKKPPCQLGLILSGDLTPKLKPAERDQLDAALKTDRGVITAAAIQQWLESRGHEVNPTRISNHRRKVCTCGDS